MLLTYLGHSCFLLEGDDGTRVLTDPCDPDTGYRIAPLRVDAVTVSHEHHDHNDTACVLGAPRILREAGDAAAGSASICAFPCWHDEAHGAKRGPNLAFRIRMDGMSVLHLGDLGHLPSEAFRAAVGTIDVLLCPVGGVYTIDGCQAAQVVSLLAPRVVVPMHYRTPQLAFQLDGIEPFLRRMSARKLLRADDSSFSIDADVLAQESVLVLAPAANAQKNVKSR